MNRLKLVTPQERTLPYALREQAKAIPNEVYLRLDEQRVTFGEVEARSNSIADGLKSLGVGPGDRVAIFAKKTIIEAILTVYAVSKLGAIWTPINTEYKGDWLIDLLGAADAKVILTDKAMSGRLAEVLDRIPHEAVVMADAEEGEAPPIKGAIPFQKLAAFPATPQDISHISYGDTNAILWTSGTTGKSKGVMQSHNVWIRLGENHADFFQTRDGDVAYNVMPIYNSSFFMYTFRTLIEGITCAYDAEFSVTKYWDRVRYYGATQIFTLGAMHIFLWQQPERPDDADNPARVGNVIPLPEHLVKPYRKRFGLERISQGYGQSEAQNITKRISTDETNWKPNALGRPHNGIEVKLLDDEGREVGPNEIGEFCVKPLSPHVIFNGYYKNPEATAAAYFGEWYRTGDLGRRDEDGDLFFVDRKRDAIRYKGRNISTIEVETAVRKHPKVEDAAAFGIQSKELESEYELALSVIPKADASLSHEELARFINDNAPYYFVPRYMEFVKELPYTPTGKVQKYMLRERGVTPATWDLLKSDFKVER
jgi:crotonobetaine/carnitine-CoA ligase